LGYFLVRNAATIQVETNENPPFGTMPTKAFRVLLFLYEENVNFEPLGCLAFQCVFLQQQLLG